MTFDLGVGESVVGVFSLVFGHDVGWVRIVLFFEGNGWGGQVNRSAPIYRGLDPLTLACGRVELVTLTLVLVNRLEALCLLGFSKVNRDS